MYPPIATLKVIVLQNDSHLGEEPFLQMETQKKSIMSGEEI